MESHGKLIDVRIFSFHQSRCGYVRYAHRRLRLTVGTDALVSAKVLEQVTGMETVFGDFKLQPIAGSMQKATDAFGLP